MTFGGAQRILAVCTFFLCMIHRALDLVLDYTYRHTLILKVTNYFGFNRLLKLSEIQPPSMENKTFRKF